MKFRVPPIGRPRITNTHYLWLLSTLRALLSSLSPMSKSCGCNDKNVSLDEHKNRLAEKWIILTCVRTKLNTFLMERLASLSFLNSILHTRRHILHLCIIVYQSLCKVLTIYFCHLLSANNKQPVTIRSSNYLFLRANFCQLHSTCFLSCLLFT